MFYLASVIDPLAQVSAHGALEHLHHEGEHRAREGRVPSSLGRLVADEGVLGLDFEELRARAVREGDEWRGVSRLTDVVMLASSRVFRMRSRPALGTWVS